MGSLMSLQKGVRNERISDPVSWHAISLKMAISGLQKALNGVPFRPSPSPFGPFLDPFWDPISSIP